MKITKSLCSFMTIALIISSVSFGIKRTGDIEIDIHSYIDQYWESQNKIMDACVADSSGDDFQGIVAAWQDCADELDSALLGFIETLLNDPESLARFGQLYAEMPIEQKEIVAPLVEQLIERGTDPENFPGYGYPEPGYLYRKGLELSREFLSSYWRKENKTVETAQTVKTTMELSIAAGWGQEQTASGNISDFKIGSTTNMNVNGSMKTMCEVTFTTKTTLITECTVKFQRTKVWFELHRIKKGFLGIGTSGNWMLCGKTYEVAEEETGEQVLDKIVR